MQPDGRRCVQVIVDSAERRQPGHCQIQRLQRADAMRERLSQRTPLYNGNIECRLFRFDMVKGGMRDRPARDTASGSENDNADA